MRPFHSSGISLVYLGNLLVYSYLVNSSTKNSCKLVFISGSKTYAQIREDTWKLFCVFPCIPCEKNSHAKAQSDAERYVLLFLCQILLHTEMHRMTQKFVLDKRTEEHIFVSRRRRRRAQKLCDTLRLCVRINNMSAKVCGVCVRQKRAARILCLPCIPCEKTLTQTAQTARSYLFFSFSV